MRRPDIRRFVQGEWVPRYVREEVLKKLTEDPRFRCIDGVWQIKFDFSTQVWAADAPMENRFIQNFPEIVRNALSNRGTQKNRCESPNSAQYKHYGAKGVQCLWTASECVNFFLNEILKRESWVLPVVARIDDAGDYVLGNVSLVEQSENADEHWAVLRGRRQRTPEETLLEIERLRALNAEKRAEEQARAATRREDKESAVESKKLASLEKKIARERAKKVREEDRVCRMRIKKSTSPEETKARKLREKAELWARCVEAINNLD